MQKQSFADVLHNSPVDTRRRFNVYTTSIRRPDVVRRGIDVETTSCVYWEWSLRFLNIHRKTPVLESLFNKVQG